MLRLARLGALLAWCVSVAACTLNWEPVLPGTCGAAGQACCVEGGITCRAGLACTSGTCQAPCASGTIACAGACVDVASSVAHCGSCGHACQPGQTCTAGNCGVMCPMGQTACAGVCEDLRTSATNCGACGNACDAAIPHAGATCAAGSCHFVACTTGFGDCDGNQSNGCETDTVSTPAHCGTCGNVCPAGGPNQLATCASSVCGTSCAAGFADCNAITTDGCETPTATDPMHCGTCATVCPGGSNATPGCAAGVCTMTCAANFGDCDHVAANGCEVDLRASDQNCGACGTRCPGMRVCIAGVCN